MSPLTPFVILIFLPIAMGFYAHLRVQSQFRKNRVLSSSSGLTGKEIAERILQKMGIFDVIIKEVEGELTDHYNATKKILALSRTTYNSSDIAAISIAAHEVGHAIQDNLKYPLLQARMKIVPITQVASQILPIIAIMGILFKSVGMIRIAAITYIVLFLFQLITLPVEFDASKRARILLWNMGAVKKNELSSVKSMLDAAALTYLASFVSSLAYLLHLFFTSKQK